MNYELLTVNCESSTVNCELSTVNCEIETVSCDEEIHVSISNIFRVYSICYYQISDKFQYNALSLDVKGLPPSAS